MKNLAEHPAIMGVKPFFEAGETGNAIVLPGIEELAGVLGGLMNRGDLGDDQTGTACGARR